MCTLFNLFRKSISIGLILLMMVMSPGAAYAQNEGLQVRITQVDNSQFPQVTVYISVLDAAGEPAGVNPSQIVIHENGQPMEPDQVNGSGDTGPLTTLLVIDISGSMNVSSKLPAAKAAAQAYVDQMRPGDQAGLLIFNTETTYLQAITSDHTVLTNAIASIEASGNTAMFDALVQADLILQGIVGRKAIIALTDGLDNRSQSTADDVIQAIGPGGLSISTVGLGDPKEKGNNYGLDEAVLKSLAERAGGVYGFADDPEMLTSLYERYGRVLQSEYRITYTSPSTLRDGVNRILTVSLESTRASAQAQYNPGGVLPEVPHNATWSLFAAILGGLLVLVFVPGLISRSMQFLSDSKNDFGTGRKQRPRIKLK